ncbi:MAG: hypothetical protein ABEJ79_01050 [Halolamina sp.]
MDTRPRSLALAATPALALAVVVVGFQYAYALTTPGVALGQLFTLARAVADAAVFGVAAAAGWHVGRAGGLDGAGGPSAVFGSFLLAAVGGGAGGVLVLVVAGPAGVTVGPAWAAVGHVVAARAVPVGFAGVAGAAVADYELY